MTIAIASLVAICAIGADGSADDRAQARALFEEAAVAKKEERWADVRSLLERSCALYPQFSTAWNLVTAHEQLDDLPAAESLLVGLRDGAYGALGQKEEAAVLDRLASISKELGTIALEVGEPKVAVTIDGQPRGVVDDDGRASLRVPSGTHVVRVASADGRSLERSIDVARGESRPLRFTFSAGGEVGRLVVEADDPAAPIAVDGVEAGKGKIDLRLEPGTYRVGLIGGEARAIALAGGEIERVRLQREDPGALSPWLWVAIGAVVVAGAVVTAVVIAGSDADPLPADFIAPPL